MRKVLNKKFFDRPVLEVAPDMLGKFLVRKSGNKEVALMITEVEAYDGEEDLACHASKGRTMRTETLYDEAGTFYVYLCYGIHWLLNIVTGERDYPAAVLIRGVEGISGPGKVTKEFSIDKKFHSQKASKATGLWLEDRGIEIFSKDIRTTPRIGVAYAKEWAKKEYRFIMK